MLLNNLGESSAYRNIREDVKLFLYTNKIQQGHCHANKTRRVVFCSDFKMFWGENPVVPGSIWFGDKPHFYLNGYINQLNICAWTIEKLYNIMQTRLRPEECMVSSALSQSSIAGPIFVDVIVTTDRYLRVFQE